MTNKQVIDILRIIRYRYENDEDGVEFRYALDLAIKALEREENLEQAVNLKLTDEEIEQFKEQLRNAPLVVREEQEVGTTGDLISRSELIKHKFLTPDAVEAKKWLPAETKGYQLGWNDCIDAIIDNAPTVEVKPFAKFTFDKDELNRIVDERVIEPIKNGELVIKDERPRGEWVDEGQYAEGHNEHYYRCSECGGHIIKIRVDDFCPNCGADMRKEAENEDSY